MEHIPTHQKKLMKKMVEIGSVGETGELSQVSRQKVLSKMFQKWKNFDLFCPNFENFWTSVLDITYLGIFRE